MSLHEKFVEAYLFEAGLPPANRAAATYNGSWLAMKGHHRGVIILRTGVMAATATLDLSLQQAQDAAGTGAKAFTPAKAITQLTQAGGDANDIVLLEFDVEDMDAANNFTHVRFVLTIANAAVFTNVEFLRGPGEDRPVSTTPLTEAV